MPQPSKYAVAVDVVVLADEPDPPSVLLVRRRNPPLGWAIPGGFVEPDEDLPTAARRELREETGAGAETLHLIGAYGRPDRDPRGRTISIAFGIRLRARPSTHAGDDAAEARWFPLNALPQDLAFDHPDILRDAVARLLPASRGG